MWVPQRYSTFKKSMKNSLKAWTMTAISPLHFSWKSLVKAQSIKEKDSQNNRKYKTNILNLMKFTNKYQMSNTALFPHFKKADSYTYPLRGLILSLSMLVKVLCHKIVATFNSTRSISSSILPAKMELTNFNIIRMKAMRFKIYLI